MSAPSIERSSTSPMRRRTSPRSAAAGAVASWIFSASAATVDMRWAKATAFLCGLMAA